ncbi:hypothetical protein [Mitsuaria sp. GD03876]|uniref:hypothetical protein n=1 Tax=Mitsuaria sp. GD03876 TaxID=2975399 RepID=UPI002447BFE3|nr:hypothetical protein [Mitsuaria sp. GD03876]MDH0867711.1 hypothetical protein [Mitsuaria sp. GD03876]
MTMNARWQSAAATAAIGMAMAAAGTTAAGATPDPSPAQARAEAPSTGMPAVEAASLLLGPDEQVGWVSQAAWSQRWWEWAMSFDNDTSPVADRTGLQCGNRQNGDVFFLAGTYGTARTMRTCRVPADKYLFFPLINYVVVPTRQGQPTCAKVVSDAERITDGAELLVLEIDGVRYDRLQRHRQASPECFNAWTRHPSGARLYPSASNGYYVMLKPLPRGRHTLSFGGALPGMSQAVTYTLFVE